MDNERFFDYFNELIELCIFSEEKFRLAAKHVKSPELKRFFEKEKYNLSNLVRELQYELTRLGATPTSQGTIAGAEADTWLNLEKEFDASDQIILERLEASEDAIVRGFNRILNEPLPADLREILQQRYEGIKVSHNSIRTFLSNMGYKTKTV